MYRVSDRALHMPIATMVRQERVIGTEYLLTRCGKMQPKATGEDETFKGLSLVER